MKKLFKVLGITIALTTVVAVIKAKFKNHVLKNIIDSPSLHIKGKIIQE